MSNRLPIIGGLLLLALVLINATFYTVDQRERVLLFRLGEVIAADLPPGLKVKTPFINSVVKYDGRIQTLDRGPVRYQTSELKNVVVDSFVKWRIADTKRFFVSVGAGDVNTRLAQIVNDLSRNEFGKRTVQEAVSGDRGEIMGILRQQASKRAAEFGVEVVDVRLKRVDLPPEVSSSVFTRMEAERKRVAAELRAKGAEEGERIRAQTRQAQRPVRHLAGQGRRAAQHGRAQKRHHAFQHQHQAEGCRQIVHERAQRVPARGLSKCRKNALSGSSTSRSRLLPMLRR
jgi:membrane protease subunit HflC